MIPDYQRNMAFVQPFVQALEQSTECFYGRILNGKYMQQVLYKFGLEGWGDYAKWATERAFEFIRKTEFPDSYGRMSSTYYCDNLSDCRKYYDRDWRWVSEEVQETVRLFEVDVDDDFPQRRDMTIYDQAYHAMSAAQDIPFVLACARRYFSGMQNAEPTWEILSDKAATVTADISDFLRNEIV